MAEVVLDKVNKQYENGFHAVQDLDLDIADGEFLVLVGPSGCGKSTALRMVAGLEDISSGTMRIGDRVVNTLSPKDRDIAMVFQSYALYPHMSVADNIAYGPEDPAHGQGRDRPPGQEGGRHAGAWAAAGAQAQAALGRPAPARGHGPGHRPRAPGVPDGRAPVQPGRQAAGADALGDRPGPARPERHHHLCDPRPDRGHDHGRPGRGHEGRDPPGGRRPPVPVRQPGQHLRGRLHRLPADEPGRRQGRPPRRQRRPGRPPRLGHHRPAPGGRPAASRPGRLRVPRRRRGDPQRGHGGRPAGPRRPRRHPPQGHGVDGRGPRRPDRRPLRGRRPQGRHRRHQAAGEGRPHRRGPPSTRRSTGPSSWPPSPPAPGSASATRSRSWSTPSACTSSTPRQATPSATSLEAWHSAARSGTGG